MAVGDGCMRPSLHPSGRVRTGETERVSEPLQFRTDRVAEFEADLRARLLAIVPSGVFRDEPSFAYDLARRPRR